MTILWDIRMQAPEALDETSAFLSRTWLRTGHGEDRLSASPLNSIKFTYDRELIAERPVTEILSMAGRAAGQATSGV